MKHMIGETFIHGLSSAGASQILPEYWLMEFIAIGTRAQKTDCHDTITGIAGVVSVAHPDEGEGAFDGLGVVVVMAMTALKNRTGDCALM